MCCLKIHLSGNDVRWYNAYMMIPSMSKQKQDLPSAQRVSPGGAALGWGKDTGYQPHICLKNV